MEEVVNEDRVLYKCYVCGQISERATSVDSSLRTELTSKNQLMHFFVGLIVENEKGQILLSQRRIFPVAWTLFFSHLYNEESLHQAAQREMITETGLYVSKFRLLSEKMVNLTCRTGVKKHSLNILKTKISAKSILIPNSESLQLSWVGKEMINHKPFQPLSPGTKLVLKEMGWIK